jgi:predicted aspartyl protease
VLESRFVVEREKTFGDVALADTGATGIIIDKSVAEELKLNTFGEAEIVTLGTVVKCGFADVIDTPTAEACGILGLLGFS